jgi:stage II sporulation protein D
VNIRTLVSFLTASLLGATKGAMLIVFAALVVADQDVTIEVPSAPQYALAAKGLTLEDAGGVEKTDAPKVSLGLCDGALCPPLDALQLPLKIRADGPIAVNDRRLAGTLWAVAQGDAIVLVNRLPLEEYLVATVGSEMPRTFPKEALKAQAVAARTYALSRKITREGATAHLRSSTLDQVYGGLAQESAETRAAVRATTGEVLVYDRQPIEAFFFSSCNGTTRDGATVFGGDYPYLKSVQCSKAHETPWSARLSLAELEKRLGVGKVSGVEIAGTTADGRPEAIVVQPTGKRLAPEEVRKRVGYTLVKSADVHVACDKRGCTFSGAGYGHGVGMCQHGAKAMAEQGKSYREILEHYYPGAQLKKL